MLVNFNMDDTIFGFLSCFFLLYWIFVKDPVTTEDTRLDENTRTNLLLLTAVIAVYTCHKCYTTNGEGLQEFGQILFPAAKPEGGFAEGATAMGAVKKGPTIPPGTVPVLNAEGAPHVLEGKSFFSSATTNNTIDAAA